MSIDRLNLDALAALEAAATPGAWEAEPLDEWASGCIRDEDGNYIAAEHSDEDGALIVALRNAASTLIAAARDRDRWHDAAFAGQAHEAQLTAALEVAQAALGRVQSLHRERPWHWSDGNKYHGNTRCQGCNVNWPCDTIRALNGEVAE